MSDRPVIGPDPRFPAFVFWVLLGAAFALPALVPACRSYIPPAAFLAGVIFAAAFGNPYPRQTHRGSLFLLYLALIGFGLGLDFSIGWRGLALGFALAPVGLGLALLTSGFARRFGVGASCTELLVVGTALGGLPAVVAAAPSLRAHAQETAPAVGTLLLLNAAALLLFPLLGRLLGFDPIQFGCWVGLSLPDTTAAVGAALTASENSAPNLAAAVKLARLWLLIPAVLAFSIYAIRRHPERAPRETRFRFLWILPVFLLAIAAGNWLPGGRALAEVLQNPARDLATAALFLTGCCLHPGKFRELGLRPFLLGLTLWLVPVAAWTLLVRYWLPLG